MSTLIGSRESTPDALDRTFGVEAFREDDGTYTARMHIAHYDGIRRDSTWSSPKVPLDTPPGDDDAAREAARDAHHVWRRSLMGATA